MIVVTGATGVLGRLVVDRLLELVPAGEVGASVRDPAKAQDLTDRGVRVRRGDFTEPATLTDAFSGADQVLVVSANTLGPDGVAQHRAAIEAAVGAGADRVLYTAHQGARPDSPFAAAADHAATEEILAGCGAAWTSLRNGFYANTVPMFLADAASTGELRLPDDGPVAWTTREDLAAATARLLVDGAPDGPTAPLTGPEAVDFSQVAAALGELTARTIRRVVVEPAEYREVLVGRGVPDHAADLLLGFFPAAARGDFAPADPTLADLVGRPATPIAEVLRASPAPTAS
ncbi:NAD(P)H-binding protein [Actinomycetospora sp. NBRC 106378]|uniref:NAD(P)H-binding protein n=1 Tax=Actinomycetospora sp. NBRC 106378 TaxID=3032208 RepID=UPI0024A4EAFD|nr:NAD(P)H-binding protein [Actinomycetospora sp. NBRC 106378]GLZ50562.1 NmrA family transcriptional regulator [Actinomycetospora sp. NBRC 106378]